MSLTFEPLIAPALWVTLAAMTAAMLAAYAWRRPAGLTRRRWLAANALAAAGAAAVLLILLNPTWLEPIPPPAGKPLLTVLVDTSSSMATEDAGGGNTRLKQAAKLAGEFSAKLDSRFDVRIKTFSQDAKLSDAVTLQAAKANGHLTDLAVAIAGSLDDDRPQGQAVVLLSDGVHNGPTGMPGLLDVVRTAKAMSVPVYTTTLGTDTIRKDLDVSLQRPQELAFAGQNVPVTVTLRQRGLLSDRADVVLLHNGREIGRQRANLRANDTASVQFQVRQNESGLYRYEVRTDPQPGEATAANNSATLLLRVVKKPIRVLLLEGKPYWDTKFLVRTLAADPSLELDSIVRLRSGRYVKRSLRVRQTAVAKKDAAKPVEFTRSESTAFLDNAAAILNDEKALADFQVVVLGRDAETYLGDAVLERVRTWISRDGGSLVCFRGSPVAQVNQSLARLMPVRWSPVRESRFRMTMTTRGRTLHWLSAVGSSGSEEVLTRLPSLSTIAQPGQPKPLAVVLARSNAETGPPAVTYQPYGTGRVVVIEGSGMWRWAFLAPQYQKHDAVYASLWQSLLRWLVSGVGLVPGQNVALRTDKVSFSTLESAAAVLLLRVEAGGTQVPRVDLRREDGTKIKTETPVPLGDEPGVYQIVFGRLPEGRYRAQLIGGEPRASATGAATSIAFDVRRNDSEQLDVAARPDVMQRIARDSGGAVIAADDPAGVAERFREHLSRSRPERLRRLSAWDRWWVLLFVLATWSAAWGIRRAGGLV